MNFSPKLLRLAQNVEISLAQRFSSFEEVSFYHTARISESFSRFRVSDSCFVGTTGYGYDDVGRETLENVYADIFGTEAALVRTSIVNGTHAIACMLYGTLAPGDLLLSATGMPYDTLLNALTGEGHGTLRSYGMRFESIDLLPSGEPDYELLGAEVFKKKPRAVFIQHSRGYAQRRALTVVEIERICRTVKDQSPDTLIICDNCYGEFCEKMHPTQVGVDLMAGSLIKNPGGGLAPAGGYIVGKSELVQRAAERLTVPGIGGECGATLGQNRLLFQGLFLAPHTVCQALKTAAFAAGMLKAMGYDTSPAPEDVRSDIIQTLSLRSPENMIRFCGGIQSGSPVDSFVSPVPAPMPGYSDPVIMAAGTFIQGASLELSCDGPLRPPYTAYLQGGLTYESGKLGILSALQRMNESD